ncbi:MAG: TonB-dependent receptor, partial [Akkermansiaceae bacterium]|nr:TonB-dependent receptor [Akkermansiaceae bacterium]
MIRAKGEPTRVAAPAAVALVALAAAAIRTSPARAATPEPVALPALEVLASRVTDESGAGTIAAWSRDDLLEAAPRTLDEVLATEPSFSLYRRQSAVFGNPTSSGVSLRNTGATAASRTLVVLDGIPQNDPFGGWVSWARYDSATLDSLRIVGPSRAVVWGNQSPAGMIQLTGRDPWTPGHSVRASGGSQGSVGASAWSRQVDRDQRTAVAAGGYFFETGGFRAVAPWQRGPIDERLDTTFAGGSLGGAWRPAEGLTLEPLASYHYEDRGNGTPLSRNSTSAADFSLRLTAEEADWSWQVIAYHQERDFDSVFTSVNATRTAETLALNQYDVPARGTGGAWIVRGEWTDALTLTGGADVRFLTGETRELVGTFRHRVAGGRQATQGLFGALNWQPGADTVVEVGLRADWWQLTRGQRTESLLATGATVRDERQPDRDSWEPSASLEIRHDLADDLTASASAGSSFRLPTLNELHRPFRVRNDIVEANPALDPERFFSIAAGLEWQPSPEWEWRVEAFHHWIDDAIANVPVTDPARIA